MLKNRSLLESLEKWAGKWWLVSGKAEGVTIGGRSAKNQGWVESQNMKEKSSKEGPVHPGCCTAGLTRRNVGSIPIWAIYLRFGLDNPCGSFLT